LKPGKTSIDKMKTLPWFPIVFHLANTSIDGLSQVELTRRTEVKFIVCNRIQVNWTITSQNQVKVVDIRLNSMVFSIF
jgi:hypothetical protein